MPAPSGKTTIVDNLSSRLSELGIELPEPPTPLGAISHKQMEFFVNANKSAARSFLSGERRTYAPCFIRA